MRQRFVLDAGSVVRIDATGKMHKLEPNQSVNQKQTTRVIVLKLKHVETEKLPIIDAIF